MLQSENSVSAAPEVRSDEAETKKYGIKNLPVDCFHYRQFRYGNLNDAIAQAKRDERLDNRTPAP
ncbi:MAG: hypothetical protein HXY25_01165 [Alphaproteobacteria bacterium]|nr:hypothetical protein [Alphaproteobacteria bacterium]